VPLAPTYAPLRRMHTSIKFAVIAACTLFTSVSFAKPTAPTKAEAPVAKAVPTPAAKAVVPTAAKAEIGKPAPDFTLTDLAGKEVKLSSFVGKTVVLEWFNPSCPFVKKSHTVGSLIDTAKRHSKAGVVWLAINSGAAGKQGNELALNTEAAKTWSLEHPILRDEAGTVGKAYGATNTPHLFVINKKGVLAYAGAIDNSPDAEGKSPEGGKLVNYVDAALADLAAGKPVTTPSTKAYGCGVKYGS
jgi:peroxiredoxin